MFEAILSGWRSQQTARYFKAKTARANEVGVRRVDRSAEPGLQHREADLGKEVKAATGDDLEFGSRS